MSRVIVDREIMDYFIMFSTRYTYFEAYFDLILLARKDQKVFRTYSNLAFRWKWSPSKVKRFIKLLEVSENIRIENHSQRKYVFVILKKYWDHE